MALALSSASRSLRVQHGQQRLSPAASRVPTPVNGPRRSRSSPIARVTDITSEAQFEQEVLQADVPVLVDFWAPWCGPCKLMAPLMTWAEKEHNGALKVVKVEHDPNKALIEKYKVYGLPALMMFKDGQEVAGSKNEGAVTKAMLTAYIKKHAPAAVSV